MIRLVIGSAFIDDPKRIDDYRKSFNLIKLNSHLFDRIDVMETISHSDVEYIEDSGFNTFYSKIGNPSSNKGINWMNHMVNYLNLNCSDDDIIVFISGRYMLRPDNNLDKIIEYMNKYQFVAKDDSDLFVGDGVHTFIIFFRKNKFLEFQKYHTDKNLKSPCIEHDLKRFLISSENCLILPKEFQIGIETNYYLSDIYGIC